MYIEKSIWPETSQPARNPPTHGHHFSSFQRQPQLLRNPNTRTHANPTKKRENGLAIAIPIPKFLIPNFLIPNHFSLSLRLKPQESETGNGHHDHEERQYRRRGSSPGHGAADREEPQCAECTPGSMPHFPGPLFPAVRRIPTPLQGLSTSACSSPTATVPPGSTPTMATVPPGPYPAETPKQWNRTVQRIFII